MAGKFKSAVEPFKTSEEAAAHIFTTINHGMAALGMGMAAHVGLFDVMAKMEGPATPADIAEVGDLKERYVKELLGLLVYHRLVCVDDSGSLYWLPETHKLHLIGLSANHLTQVPLLATNFHQVAECFKRSGPTGTTNNDSSLQESMSEVSKAKWTWDFISASIFPKAPGLFERLKKGLRVLDMGCGRGDITLVLAENLPNSQFTGIDLRPENIKTVKNNKDDMKLGNAEFHEMEVYKMPEDWTDFFDLVVAKDLIHDLPFVAKCLTEIRRVMKPSGCYVMVDQRGHSHVTQNLNDLFAVFRQCCSVFYCMPGSLTEDGADGYGGFWGQELARKCLEDAGFTITCEDDATDSEKFYICKI